VRRRLDPPKDAECAILMDADMRQDINVLIAQPKLAFAWKSVSGTIMRNFTIDFITADNNACVTCFEHLAQHLHTIIVKMSITTFVSCISMCIVIFY
jgi:hypothetical protein